MCLLQMANYPCRRSILRDRMQKRLPLDTLSFLRLGLISTVVENFLEFARIFQLVFKA